LKELHNNTFLIKSILSNETTISPKSPHSNTKQNYISNKAKASFRTKQKPSKTYHKSTSHPPHSSNRSPSPLPTNLPLKNVLPYKPADPKASTMNKVDLKKLTQELHLPSHLHSQALLSTPSSSLLTQSEPSSTTKLTSNPQGPASVDPHPSMPISPRTALQLFSDILTDYEQTEVLGKTVYFLGAKAKKIEASLMNDHNFGYDDENGDYKVVVKDHVEYRYEIMGVLGQGSFGQVLE
jgi:hypothetical protein